MTDLSREQTTKALMYRKGWSNNSLSGKFGGPEKGLLVGVVVGHSLLGAGVLGDGLGTLRDGVLGQLSGQEEPDRGLDLHGKFLQVGLYPHYTVYIYKKKFLAKTKRLKLISNHSMVVRGVYYNPFQGSQGPQEGSKAKILTF